LCIGGQRPNTSTVNFAANDTSANSALLCPSHGYGCVFSSVGTEMIIDIVGLWTTTV
jgi:hypothetical protein